MSKVLITGGSLYTPSKKYKNGAVLIGGSKILACGDRGNFPVPEDCEIINVGGDRIIPGLIDVHLHGMGGMDSGGPDLVHVIQRLLEHGITSFLATTYAGARPEISGAIESIVQILKDPPVGTQTLGIHMEGPWFAATKSGMSDPKHLYPLTQEDIEGYLELADGLLRMITFAPEEGNALDVIPWLVEHDVIPAIGHTNADYQTIRRAVTLGVCHATHTYNAMRGLHHREPGALGAVMDHKEVIAEIVADGHHVHPAAIRILLAVKGTERLCLVSDATPPAGAPPGVYEWMGYKLIHDGQTSRLENGTLVGSATLINRMLKVLVDTVGIPFEEALTMATETPATVLGVKKGKISPGYDADIVVLRDDYKAALTMVMGEVVYWK
jgi:N-acetylglucosamine-6-phosphate deacetylase